MHKQKFEFSAKASKIMQPITLDAIDRKMLRLLRADGRMSNAALASAVGLSPPACLRRPRLPEA